MGRSFLCCATGDAVLTCYPMYTGAAWAAVHVGVAAACSSCRPVSVANHVPGTTSGVVGLVRRVGTHVALSAAWIPVRPRVFRWRRRHPRITPFTFASPLHSSTAADVDGMEWLGARSVLVAWASMAVQSGRLVVTLTPAVQQAAASVRTHWAKLWSSGTVPFCATHECEGHETHECTPAARDPKAALPQEWATASPSVDPRTVVYFRPTVTPSPSPVDDDSSSGEDNDDDDGSASDEGDVCDDDDHDSWVTGPETDAEYDDEDEQEAECGSTGTNSPDSWCTATDGDGSPPVFTLNRRGRIVRNPAYKAPMAVEPSSSATQAEAEGTDTNTDGDSASDGDGDSEGDGDVDVNSPTVTEQPPVPLHDTPPPRSRSCPTTRPDGTATPVTVAAPKRSVATLPPQQLMFNVCVRSSKKKSGSRMLPRLKAFAQRRGSRSARRRHPRLVTDATSAATENKRRRHSTGKSKALSFAQRAKVHERGVGQFLVGGCGVPPAVALRAVQPTAPAQRQRGLSL